FSFSPQSNAVRKSRAARKEQHRDRHTHSHSQPLKAPCGYGWPNSPSAERKTRGDRPSEVVVKNVQRSVLRCIRTCGRRARQGNGASARRPAGPKAGHRGPGRPAGTPRLQEASGQSSTCRRERGRRRRGRRRRGEEEEEEEEEEEGPRWRKKTAPRGSPCGPSSAFGKHPRPGSRGAGSDRRTDGGEEEMERARQVGAHCVKAALPVEGSIEAAQRQRHASRGAQGRTHTQIHRHISKHRLRTSARPAEAAAVTPPPRAAPGPGPMAPRPRERLSVEGSMPCSAWGED
ncbi:unnamed protein product, partial [Prorocentrum cordatum]